MLLHLLRSTVISHRCGLETPVSRSTGSTTQPGQHWRYKAEHSPCGTSILKTRIVSAAGPHLDANLSRLQAPTRPGPTHAGSTNVGLYSIWRRQAIDARENHNENQPRKPRNRVHSDPGTFAQERHVDIVAPAPSHRFRETHASAWASRCQTTTKTRMKECVFRRTTRSKPNAPSQKTDDRVQLSGLVKTKGTAPKTAWGTDPRNGSISCRYPLTFNVALNKWIGLAAF